MAHLEHPDFKAIAAFTVTEPTGASQPFVFNSPHSGNIYPKRFLDLSKLDAVTIRRSEDLFVDELFNDIPEIGAPLLAAMFPRAYLDLNREPYELDPKMYTGPLPAYANVRSIRVAGGLGTVARVVAESQEIYADKIEVEDALTRVEMLYKPYHAMLRKLLAETHARHGRAYLIDCHSMPSGGDERGTRPDFVLGDRYGTSCPSALTEIIADLLSERGYLVNRNKPYAG
ncbi:MAG: N-formylglutamate amidohydrolase, partial [Pseudomonadota bacterium]